MSGDGPSGDPHLDEAELDRALELRLSALRTDAAIAARRRERLARDIFEAALTMPGLLAGAVGETVTLHIVGAGRFTGTVVDVDTSAVRLATASSEALCAVSAVEAVESPASLRCLRSLPEGSWEAQVEALCELEADVRLVLRSGAELAGRVVGVGDVVTLRDDGSGRCSYASPEVVAVVSRRS